MKNKQTAVLSYFRKTIKAIPSINYVGIYPAFGEISHDNYPAVLIRDGNESLDEDFGFNGIYSYIYTVQVYLYQMNQKLRFDCLNVQASISDAILDDPTLGGAAMCCNLSSVEKGDYTISPDLSTAFISEEDNMRILSFAVKISTTR